MNVKDNRSFWVYLLLSIVTCGLYSIYFWYVYVEDLNTIFYGDGEDSPNYIIVLLLSWVTCGIYGVYWRYKQANRMYRESYDRYGVMIEENGSAILLWTLLGYLTGGIGQLVADYFMIQNLNKTADGRKVQRGKAVFREMIVQHGPDKEMIEHQKDQQHEQGRGHGARLAAFAFLAVGVGGGHAAEKQAGDGGHKRGYERQGHQHSSRSSSPSRARRCR